MLDAACPAGEVKLDTTEYDLGARRWLATGETLARLGARGAARHDAILLGAVGDPACRSGVLERGLLLRLRFELDHHVNLRPARLFPGVTSPLGTRRHRLRRRPRGHRGPVRRQRRRRCAAARPHEIATEVSLNTAYGVERVVRDAFGRASATRRHLTLVHKNNVLVHAGDLWTRTVDAGGGEFPTSRTDYLHVDAATIFIVTDPERFDVIVTDNLFGDILTDLAAAVTGGIGLAASGNLDVTAPTRRCSSRCTARPRTSPGRAGPTRPRQSCRRRSCSSTSGCGAASASRRRSPRTWPPGAGRLDRTSAVGAALLDGL